MSFLEIVLGIVSILGTIGTFYFGAKAERMAREKQRFSWGDVEEGCRTLNRTAIGRFKPDIIICFSGPSSIIANLMIQLSNYFVPVYTSVLQKPDILSDRYFSTQSFEHIVTSQWQLHVPAEIFLDKTKRVLLVDDYVHSGESLSVLKQKLLDRGFPVSNVKSCALICSNIAKEANRAPDYFKYLLDNSVFYLPWGKAY